MKDKPPVAPASIRVPALLFAELPSEAAARFSALHAVQEAFEAAYHAHSQSHEVRREASDPKSINP